MKETQDNVLKCSKCGGKTRLINVRNTPVGNVRRRRECETCKERFTTLESITVLRKVTPPEEDIKV